MSLALLVLIVNVNKNWIKIESASINLFYFIELFNPCLNNGQLKVNYTTFEYECNCSASYYGKNCEKYNPCYSTPCFNNGTCVDLQTNGGYFCNCKSGFVGDYCQLNPSLPCIDKYPDLCTYLSKLCNSIIAINSYCPVTCSLCSYYVSLFIKIITTLVIID